MKFEPKFYLDNSKLPETFVIMAVTCSDGRLKYSTGLKISPKEWPEDIKDLKVGALKTMIGDLQKHINAYKILYRVTRGTPIPKEQVKEDLDKKYDRTPKVNRTSNTGAFYRDADLIITDMRNHKIKKPGTNKVYAKNSIKSVSTTIDRLWQFEKDSGLSVAFEDVTEETYKAYLKWANSKEFEATTVNTHIAGWKILSTHAREHLEIKISDWFNNKRFKGLKAESSVKFAMSDADIEKLLKLEGLTDLEKKARDFFVFNCQTGLRVSDSQKVTNEDIDEDGILNIGTEKEKEIAQFLNTKARNIIKADGGNVPEKIPYSTYNKYLKLVCKLAKLNEKILVKKTVKGETVFITKMKWELVSSHTARRTAITNMRSNNVDVLDMDALVGAVPATIKRYDQSVPKGVAKKVKDNSYFK